MGKARLQPTDQSDRGDHEAEKITLRIHHHVHLPSISTAAGGSGEEIEVKMVQIATSTRGTDEEQDPHKPHHAQVRNCDRRTNLHQLIKQISGLSMQSRHANGDAGDLAADSFPIQFASRGAILVTEEKISREREGKKLKCLTAGEERTNGEEKSGLLRWSRTIENQSLPYKPIYVCYFQIRPCLRVYRNNPQTKRP